ncbi:Metallo-dependent phosphatase-like protein [Terfezia claveryi]|nr:Metallo-dependent phosphatase-like protein [Terfezia claveryi]
MSQPAPQLSKPPLNESAESGKSPLLNADSGRSRTYSQSYQATKGSGALRYGIASVSKDGTGYGVLSDRDTNVSEHHATSRGERRYSRGGLSGFVWGSPGTHTEAEKGRIDQARGVWGRRRLLVLAGMLLLGTSVLWTLTRSYRQESPPTPFPSKSSTSTSPGKSGYIHLITLPFKLQQPPPPVHRKPKYHSSRRLILVGDVHGALDELKALLQKLDYDPSNGADHLVLTGDMVSKGPKSGGVLDLMRKLSEAGVASCVRGNHDDRVVRAYERLHRAPLEEEEKQVSEKAKSADENEEEAGKQQEDPQEEIHGNYIEDWRDDDLVDSDGKKKKKGSKRRQRKRASDEAVAKTLTSGQAKFLASCPLILRVQGAGNQGGELLVVHAGIVPGVPLLKQNPKLLMNMRTILPPKGAKGKGKTDGVGNGSSTTKGRHWAEVWNEWEEKRVKGNLGEQELKMPEVFKGIDQLGMDFIPVDILVNTNEGEEGELVQSEVVVEQAVPVPENMGPYGNAEKGATVVYGHYAAKGLDIRKWTKGLDSNCVRGGRLSALVVKKEKGEVVMDVVSVKCKEYVS